MLPKTYTQTLSFTYNSVVPKSHFLSGRKQRLDITKILDLLTSNHNEDLSGLTKYELETLNENENFEIHLSDDDYQEDYIRIIQSDEEETLYFFDAFRVEDYEVIEFYTENGDPNDEDALLVIRGKFVFDIVEQYSVVWNDWVFEWEKKLVYERSTPINTSVYKMNIYTHTHHTK